MSTPKPLPSPILDQHRPKASAVESQILADLDTSIQLRVGGTDKAVVSDYAARYRDGKELPPIVVFFDSATTTGETKHWLADGQHRVKAARAAGLDRLDALIKIGDRRAAILYATQANADHGHRLTQEDKRNAVTTILADDEWVTWSDAQIADHCRVSADLVAKMRKLTGRVAAVRKGKDGKARKVVNSRAQSKAKKAKSLAAAESAQADDQALAAARVQVDRLASALERFCKRFNGDDNPAVALVTSLINAMPPIKVRILAAVHAYGIASGNCIDRTHLAELVQEPLDVHPGQLVRAGLLEKTNTGLYDTMNAMNQTWKEFQASEENRNPKPTTAITSTTTDTTSKATTSEATAEPETIPPPAPEPSLESKRLRHVHLALAAALDAVDTLPDETSARDLLLYALTVGIPALRPDQIAELTHSPETIRDHFYRAVAREIADRLRAGRTYDLHGIPKIAETFRVDLDALTIAAEQAYP